MIRFAKALLRSSGFDVVRFPHPNSLERHLKHLLTSVGADCVLDVGANSGEFARLLRQIGFQGWIVSFEPNPAHAPALASNFAGDAKWAARQHALGADDGTLTLHIPPNDVLASALTLNDFARQNFGGKAVDASRDVSVAVHRLDSILGSLKDQFGFARPFLKLDTQGFDLQAFEGARGCWPELVGLMTEVSFKPIYQGMPDVCESLEVIRSAGFDVTGMFPVASDRTGAMLEMDCVARRR